MNRFCLLIVLSVVELSHVLAICLGVIGLHLKCLLGDYILAVNGMLVVLNVAEQSQALADLYAKCFFFVSEFSIG